MSQVPATIPHPRLRHAILVAALLTAMLIGAFGYATLRPAVPAATIQSDQPSVWTDGRVDNCAWHDYPFRNGNPQLAH